MIMFEDFKPELGLHFGAGDSSVTIDWREAAGEDCEGFTYWEVVQAELNGEYIDVVTGNGSSPTHIVVDGTAISLYDHERYIDALGGWKINDEDEDVLPEGALDADEFDALSEQDVYSDGPMMNYWYPLDVSSDFDPVEAAAKIAHTNLCVVLVGDDYGLALTGGGMDFSWEIALAFIRIGYYPPAWITDPPRYSSELDDDQRLVLRALVERDKIRVRNITWNIEQNEKRLAEVSTS